MRLYHCADCKRPFPPNGFPHRCQHCGGVFVLDHRLPFSPKQIDHTAPGIWRYAHAFGLSNNAPMISLGEGNTPLSHLSNNRNEIYLKQEYQNPTGSYKDRATPLVISELVARGYYRAIDDSSGNAGASFAAYAARAGIKAEIYMPKLNSGSKRAQIEAYAADAVLIKGDRQATAEAIKEAAQNATYASHALIPFGLAGIGTIAFEICEQLGSAPGTVIAPAGHGSLLLGVAKGFEALLSFGVIGALPKLVAVQAKNMSPLWERFYETESAQFTKETMAEGVAVANPVRGAELLDFIQQTDGKVIAIEEEKILPARNALANLGFYVEPTSAIAWAALETVRDRIPEPIVIILTGTGLKA